MANKVDCKIVLLGQANVGKTCLAQRFMHNKFDKFQPNVLVPERL